MLAALAPKLERDWLIALPHLNLARAVAADEPAIRALIDVLRT